jgi:cytochrome b561
MNTPSSSDSLQARGAQPAETATPGRYGNPSIALHWLMLVLLVAVYACIELRVNFPKGSGLREGLKTAHFMLGLSVLLLTAARLVLDLTGTAPPIVPEPPRSQRLLALAMHASLLALLLALPVLGWLLLSAEGKAIPFFGLNLPPLLAENKVYAGWFKTIHETGATVGYILVGLHAAAALYHHHVMRDNTLQRMMPQRR